jgi:hypothetical protein
MSKDRRMPKTRYGAIICPEVTVGAGAVLTKDVVPIRSLRACPPSRSLSWWDWSHERLRAALPDFRSLPAEAFLRRYGG